MVNGAAAYEELIIIGNGRPYCARGSVVAAMAIHRSFLPGAFDPEATAAMSEAFDAACKELGDTGQPEVAREVIAGRIIAAARFGERDPVRLREVALRKPD